MASEILQRDTLILNFDLKTAWVIGVGGLVSIVLLLSLALIWGCACCRKKRKEVAPVAMPSEKPPTGTVSGVDPRYKTLRDDSFGASEESSRKKSQKSVLKAAMTEPTAAKPASRHIKFVANYFPTKEGDRETAAPLPPPIPKSAEKIEAERKEAADREAVRIALQQLVAGQMKGSVQAKEKQREVEEQRLRDEQWRRKHRQMVSMKRHPPSPPPPPPPPPVAPAIRGVWKAAQTIMAPKRTKKDDSSSRSSRSERPPSKPTTTTTLYEQRPPAKPSPTATLYEQRPAGRGKPSSSPGFVPLGAGIYNKSRRPSEEAPDSNKLWLPPSLRDLDKKQQLSKATKRKEKRSPTYDQPSPKTPLSTRPVAGTQRMPPRRQPPPANDPNARSHLVG